MTAKAVVMDITRSCARKCWGKLQADGQATILQHLYYRSRMLESRCLAPGQSHFLLFLPSVLNLPGKRQYTGAASWFAMVTLCTEDYGSRAQALYKK